MPGTEVAGARSANVIIGDLKRAPDGKLHAFKYFKNTPRYRAGATWRFNRWFEFPVLGIDAVQAALLSAQWQYQVYFLCQAESA